MVRQLIIAALVLTFSVHVQGQVETPFYGYSGYPLSYLIKQDSTGNYYRAPDSGRIVYIARDFTTYRVFDKNLKLIVEGDLGGRHYIDYFQRFGKWTEYFENGKIKSTGFYHENHPIGLWQTFFSNGQLKKTYSYSYIQTNLSNCFCLTGSYQEFYDNGNLRINGFYKVQYDTVSVQQWSTADKFEKVLIKDLISKKYGVWTYYLANGDLEKKEEF
jgi:antitoxin component YwqK of YwqJK toxin-antitoxin module